MTEACIRDGKHEGIRRNVIRFYACWIGYFLNIGPYLAVSGLQSSINIEASLGTISLGIAYTIAFVTALFFTPTFIQRFGCKYAILTGEITHLAFVAANFYSVRLVMIITGVLLGVGEGLIWTALPMLPHYFATHHGVYGTKRKAAYLQKYTGVFFGSYYAGQVFGQVMTYAFLFGGKAAPEKISYENGKFLLTANVSLTLSNATNANYTSSLDVSGVDEYKYCGANDCQDPNITRSRISNYVPDDKLYLRILLSVLCVTSFVGITLHMRFLPTTKEESIEEANDKQEDAIADVNSNVKVQQPTLCSNLLATFRHAVSLTQLLLAPILLHSGLVYGFQLGELSRAFASCILGVEKVGLVLMTLSACSMISSVLSGRMIGFFGRNTIIPLLFIVNLANYIFCLLWRPSDGTNNLVYLSLALYGITEAGWRNCFISVYRDYFPSNQEIAFTMWNILITVGIAISFCWSPLLCVSTKIYCQTALLTTAVITYGVAEFLYRSAKERKNTLKERPNGNAAEEEDTQALTGT